MRKSLKEVLMERDNLSEYEAEDLISDAKRAYQEYIGDNDLEGAYNICEEYFGLEPDFLDDIME